MKWYYLHRVRRVYKRGTSLPLLATTIVVGVTVALLRYEHSKMD